MKTNKKVQFINKSFTGSFVFYTGQKIEKFDSLVTIPKGTSVTNQTALGIDKNYHFVNDFSKIDKCFHHDLNYYGANVPKEFIDFN